MYAGAWIAQAVSTADATSIIGIWDRYGFPAVVAIALFIYFSRELKNANSDRDGYRKELIELLRSLLSEAKATKAFCKFEAVRHEVNKNG